MSENRMEIPIGGATRSGEGAAVGVEGGAPEDPAEGTEFPSSESGSDVGAGPLTGTTERERFLSGDAEKSNRAPRDAESANAGEPTMNGEDGAEDRHGDGPGGGSERSFLSESETVRTSGPRGSGWSGYGTAESGLAGAPGGRGRGGNGPVGKSSALPSATGNESATAAGGAEAERGQPERAGGADESRSPKPRLMLTEEMRVPGIQSGGGSPERGGSSAPGPALDLETLRGLISDVVREELGGGPGEGIVRELARREVQRALADRGYGGSPAKSP